MYLPKHFDQSANLAMVLDFLKANPLAQLISSDGAGLPFVSHIPLHAVRDGASPNGLKLLGHVARASPHGGFLASRPVATVSVMGPSAYMSPSVYPDLAHVPTWNYVALNATVSVRFLDDLTDKDALLKCLIGDHEPAYAAQWRGLSESYQTGLLKAIVAFELTVTELQFKVKINQHRPVTHQPMLDSYRAGNEAQRALATWLERVITNKEGT